MTPTLRKLVHLLVVAGAGLVLLGAATDTGADDGERPTRQPVPRFGRVEIIIDAGDAPLAAYQVHVRATHGVVRIVGIEGGVTDVFGDPPYYDPKAMERDEVLIADFTTRPAEELPSGATRVATVHFMVEGALDPIFAADVEAAATHGGRKLRATVRTRLIVNEPRAAIQQAPVSAPTGASPPQEDLS